MSADATTGWAVMGTGTIATEHMVSAIRAIGHEPLWVVSRRKRDAADFAQDLEIPKSSTDLNRVLRDPLVGFSYVSARLGRRPHYIAAAANARKHVLCDGPIAATSKIAAVMVKQCRDAGVVLAVNQPFRASSVHQTMKRLIADGEIGQVQSVLVVRGGPRFAPAYRRTERPDETDSIFLSASVDDVDLARFLTNAEPVEVNALSSPPDDAPNLLACAIRLDSGAILQVHEGFGTADVESTVMVAGDRGVLLANGTLNERPNGTLIRRQAGKSELVPLRERDPYVVTAADFVGAQTKDLSWLARGEDSVVALNVVEALMISSRKRRTVTIRSEKVQPSPATSPLVARNSFPEKLRRATR
ncbi:Gfo/Idh/MocA family oxidoreductase [Mesorhizobium sp.]|uniref:Gfo/Idh/MocA family protein n=1 Tax=Mesorhizobium sp. TaxID=1871066 RepID=UPI0025C4864A|nr:Gfo/Idh/MocA family oxidoreductase [Mesorhizobium sp.]